LRDYGEIPASRVSIAVDALAAVGFGLLVVSTYAFALPPGSPTLAVYRLALEGGGEDMRLAATTLESRHWVLCSAAPPKHVRPIRST